MSLSFEDSLYHLEPSSSAVEKLENVIDYFRSHVAPRRGRKYIILDNIGALRLDEDEQSALLDLVDDDTYLLLTGIVESQVDLGGISASSRPKIKYPRAMLPMKFIDTIKQGAYDDSALLETDPDFCSSCGVRSNEEYGR